MHEIDMTNGQANIAYLGSRDNVWHRLGQEMRSGETKEAWRARAGLAWQAVKTPALIRHPDGEVRPARDRAFMVRNDTWQMLGDNCVTDIYQPVQPSELLDWFDRYIAVDERFAMDTLMSLRGGSIICGTAVYREPVTVAGDAHVARLLMSTTFDGSGATINQTCIERVVCRNTLRVAHGEQGNAIVRTRHNTKFDAARVGRELAALAQSIEQWKVVGDAMATVEMTGKQVSDYFKTLLEIPFDAKQDDISTRKMNQFRALSTAFSTTKRERDNRSSPDAWTALQAVTRYVDHERVSINGDAGEKQFMSATFGSGDALKGKAVALLMPLIRDKIAA
jgi:phage/plasmid-like protein (TIGR03299 family)